MPIRNKLCCLFTWKGLLVFLLHSTIFFMRKTAWICQSKRLNLSTSGYWVRNVDTMLISQHYENAQNSCTTFLLHSTLNKNEPKSSNHFFNKTICIGSSQWISQTSANSITYTSAAINPTLHRLLSFVISELSFVHEEREGTKEKWIAKSLAL